MNQTFMQEVSRFPTHQNSYAGSQTSEYMIFIFVMFLFFVYPLSHNSSSKWTGTVSQPWFQPTDTLVSSKNLRKTNQPKTTAALASKEKISYHEAQNHLCFMQSSRRPSKKQLTGIFWN
jgi:hypothetical protein